MLLALSKCVRRRTNVTTFMFAVSVFCLSNVGLILLHKQLTSLGSTEEQRKDLVALDYRKEGYTAADVESLLRCGGSFGMLLLLLLLSGAGQGPAALWLPCYKVP
jgi:hypothetical protein